MLPEVINAASPQHKKQMLNLADFAGCLKIEYRDLDNAEEYVLTKKSGERLTIKACSNDVDGGFLRVFSNKETV
jgi:hypothetical protein